MNKTQEEGKKFEDFNLKPEILTAIKKMGFENASKVQELSIPIILEGYDLISQAQTGTGKTAAFGLPVIDMMSGEKGETLVIVPTRELATQVSDELKKFSKNLNYKTATIFGGTAYGKQIKDVKGANIVVATPGRLIDLLEKGSIKIAPKFVILDEADEMLNMGFIQDIEKIFKFIPEERQTLMFSATMSKNVKKLALTILENPKEVKVTNKEVSNKNIEQFFYLIESQHKKEALLQLLRNKAKGKTIIFCRTKAQTDKLNSFLNENKISSLALHGDIEQRKRSRIIDAFKKRGTDILVATDVAARGIDVKNLNQVVNFDIPLDPEPYVHRIGRTGRAGETGVAHTFVALNELNLLKNIQEVVNSKITPAEIRKSEEVEKEKKAKFLDEILSQKTNKKVKEFTEELLEKTEEAGELIEQLVAYILKKNKTDDKNFSATKEEAQKAFDEFIKVGQKKNNRNRRGGWSRNRGGNGRSRRRGGFEDKGRQRRKFRKK